MDELLQKSLEIADSDFSQNPSAHFSMHSISLVELYANQWTQIVAHAKCCRVRTHAEKICDLYIVT